MIGKVKVEGFGFFQILVWKWVESSMWLVGKPKLLSLRVDLILLIFRFCLELAKERLMNFKALVWLVSDRRVKVELFCFQILVWIAWKWVKESMWLKFFILFNSSRLLRVDLILLIFRFCLELPKECLMNFKALVWLVSEWWESESWGILLSNPSVNYVKMS